MKKINYTKIYKKAANNGHWSRFKKDTDAKWGDIYENLSKKLKGNELILDIGTAEGNKFLRLGKKIKLGIGIDKEPSMIKLANNNIKKNSKFKFFVMDANNLEFSDNMFDIVTAKHSPVDFKEVFRVLKSGGIFITQQVHELDKENLKQAFRRGQGFGVNKKNYLIKRYLIEAKKAGFKIKRQSISNKIYYFNNKNKLIKHLNITPTIPNFGTKNDYKILDNFIKNNLTTRGIKTNVARFFLELKK